MFHEVIMITSVSCILLYRPAVGWLAKKKDKVQRQEQSLFRQPPSQRRRKRHRAAAAFRSCRRWLAGWIVLHVLIFLSLVRGISKGGGRFAPELDKLQLVFFKKLPSRALTRLWSHISVIYLAPVARGPLLGLFCALYGLKLNDAKRKKLIQYSSLHDLFTRTLEEETRPICPVHSLVSPADGTVVHVGKIVDGEVKQVKGVNYKLINFLGDIPLQEELELDTSSVTDNDIYDKQIEEQGLPRNDSITNLFQSFPHIKPSHGNELYHVVVYLSASDYHHFHSPADWNVQMRRHIAGELLSVAPWIVRQVPDLFVLNERVMLGGYWEHGFFSLSAVGAYNVGSIEIDMDQELVTNTGNDETDEGEVYQEEPCDKIFGSEGISARKGDHLGFFHLGSTVILVFEAPKSFEFSIKAGDRVKYGQPLGTTTAAKVHSLVEFCGE